MSNEITSATEVAFAAYGGTPGYDDGPDESANMNATHEPEPGISFHVQMQGYTKDAMDDLIVAAAAQLIVGRHNDKSVAKAIEVKCIELLTDKADAALAKITTDIIDQPLTPTFGAKQPVTMREFIGLTGQAYLTEHVGSDGKVSTDSWGRASTMSRVAWMVQRAMETRFKKEIEQATSAAIAEMQREVRAQHEAIITAEKARFAAAMAKASA